MYELKISSQFKKDSKLAVKRHKNIEKLKIVLETLISQKPLEFKYKDHLLSGEWKDHRECHIEPDWLLIYKITGDNLTLIRTGSHSDLFK